MCSILNIRATWKAKGDLLNTLIWTFNEENVYEKKELKKNKPRLTKHQ